MAKLYSERPANRLGENPKNETIEFLLNYSKSLKITRYKNVKFEANLN